MKEREVIVREWRDDIGIIHQVATDQILIRCQECKNWGTDDCPMHNEDLRNPYPTKANDFCSFGEIEE